MRYSWRQTSPVRRKRIGRCFVNQWASSRNVLRISSGGVKYKEGQRILGFWVRSDAFIVCGRVSGQVRESSFLRESIARKRLSVIEKSLTIRSISPRSTNFEIFETTSLHSSKFRLIEVYTSESFFFFFLFIIKDRAKRGNARTWMSTKNRASNRFKRQIMSFGEDARYIGPT